MIKPYHGIRQTPRRPVELVAVIEECRGECLQIGATVSRSPGLTRAVFAHDGTPTGLATALETCAQWIRGGAR